MTNNMEAPHDLATRLRERLRLDAPGYQWDTSSPPFHSSYGDWIVWGWKRSPARNPPDHPASPVSPSRFTDGELDTDSYLTGRTTTDDQTGDIPVLARISRHALRLEREYKIAEKLGRDAGKEQNSYIKVIEFIKLPPRQQADTKLVAIIAESPGPNALINMVEFGPNFYRGVMPNAESPSVWTDVPIHPKHQKTSLPLFMAFALGAVKCLEYLHHSSDVVHGDLRGDAFHFDKETGIVRLINFGIGARAFENGLTSAGWSTLTSQKGVEHKLQFIAPEQTGRTPAKPDSRTDLYSLGVLFWIMLADEPAFAGNKPLEIMQNVLNKRIAPIDSKRSDIPPLLSKVIQKMTQKKMNDRYQSTAGLRYDIEKCKQLLEAGDSDACTEFQLGSKDFSNVFVHPTRLVGRREELDAIRRVMYRAVSKASQRSAITKHGLMNSSNLSTDPSQAENVLSESASASATSRVSESWSGPLADGASPEASRLNDGSALFENTNSDNVSKSRQAPSTNSTDISASIFTNAASLTSTNNSLLHTARKLRKQGTCELISVAGEAGHGKSALLQVVQVHAREKGYYASARFDQIKKSPFEFAFRIMSTLFRQIFTESDVRTEFHDQLRALIQPAWPSLYTALELPPWLILSDAQKAKGENGDVSGLPMIRCGEVGNTASDWLNAGAQVRDRRFVQTFLDFLRLLVMHKFLCVCLDDLQFADDESLNLIQTLTSARIPLVLILTYQNEDSLTTKMRQLLRNATDVKLKPFTEEQTLEYVQETLHRSQEYVLPLVAVIQQKTLGIPFNIRELLDRLHDARTIYYSWRNSQWEFDLDGIFNQLAESGNDDFSNDASITRRLHDLPQDAKSLICWASLIGSSFKFSLLNYAMSCDCSKASPEEFLPPRTDDAVSALQAALSSFAIITTDEEDKFRFSHDRYLTAAESLRTSYAVSEMHYVLACAMMKHDPWDKTRPTQILFSQSRHICNAIDVVRKRAASYKPFRQLLYDAAEVAREQGARVIALHFLKYSLALFADDIWNTDCKRAESTYAEVVTLLTQTAGSYAFQGDFTSATKLINEIFDHTDNFLDRSAAYMIKARMHAQQGRNKEAFNSMYEALNGLGQTIERKSLQECDDEFMRLMPTLDDLQPNLTVEPTSIDPHLVTTGSVMAELLSAAFWHDTEVFYQIALKMINTYLKNGLYPQVAIAYVHMGSIASGRFDKPSFSAKMGRIAKSIMAHFPQEHYTNGRGYTMHALHLGYLDSSLETQLPVIHMGLLSSMAAGDKMIQTLNVGVTATYRIWSSHELPEIEAYILDQDEFLPGWQKDLRGGVLLRALLQFIRALQGKTTFNSPDLVMDDENHNYRKYKAFLCEKSSDATRIEIIYDTFRLQALFRFGHFEEAYQIAGPLSDEADRLFGIRYNLLIKFHLCLCIFEKMRATPATLDREEALKVVKRIEKKYAVFRAYHDENFACHHSLIQAGLTEVEGNFEACIPLYEAAVSHASLLANALDEGMSNELYAEFLIRRGCSRPARGLIDDATVAYRKIGAVGKIQQIAEKHAFTIHKTHAAVLVDQGTQTAETNTSNNQYKLYRNEDEMASQTSEDRTKAWIPPAATVPVQQSQENGMLGKTDLSAVGLDMIDLATILESSQLLSSELNVDKLLRNLTEIIVQTTGAELGGVIVRDDELGWKVGALRGPEGDMEEGIGQAVGKMPDAVAQQVALYCLRFRESLFIGNVLEDERFAISKNYRRKSPEGRAIIALPVLHGGSELLGCIYIEGPTRSFTERNTAVLRLLVNQIAISIANATLFKRLEKASASNTAMLEMQKAALEQARDAERKAKDAEAEAMEMVRLKEEAAKAKSMFLANVSHELRTPLNGVIGMSELLKNSPLSKEQEGHADSIRVCADTLLSVINDILDYSKLEAGKMQMFNVQLSLKETISEVVRALSYTNMERGLQTVEELQIDSSLLVMGDPVRLHQVFMNLLSNAYKFTAKGTVTVMAEVEREDDTTIQVICSVKDTGIGISEEQRKKLFLPFSQADSSTARSYGGTGLGLSICKAIVEIMKGSIWLTSEPGVGTTISFSLPFQKVDRSLSSSTNGSISKSADPMSIYRVATNEAITPDMPRNPLALTPRDQIRVCIAEDNAINQKIAISFVQRMNLKCSAYGDGQQAVDAIVKASAEGKPFHLVLMDCQMPVLDGYNATRELRKHADPAVSGVLIIAMTASAIRGDREKCLEAGMDNYLAKPVRANVLKHMLDGYMSMEADGEKVPDRTKDGDGNI